MKIDAGRLRIILSLMLLVGVVYLPSPAYSQGDAPNIQNLIVNGGFEGGFQEDFGIGYGWGGFSNGNAVVGWNFDDWPAAVVDGKYVQRIEIRDALDLNRYAGIYQTVSVVPGQQYKLTIKGIVRSEEGDIGLSDYGYRVQYAIDYQGDIAWELVEESEWVELDWDEQPLAEPPNGVYRVDTLETTITAKSDKLTLFIRGWKKWLNNGAGIFDLDEISIVGPAPEGFQAPVVQAAASLDTTQQTTEETAALAPNIQATTEPEMEATTEAESQTDTSSTEETSTEFQSPTEVDTAVAAEDTALPVSGRGSDNSVNYVVIIGATLILVLFAGAVTSARQRNLAE